MRLMTTMNVPLAIPLAVMTLCHKGSVSKSRRIGGARPRGRPAPAPTPRSRAGSSPPARAAARAARSSVVCAITFASRRAGGSSRPASRGWPGGSCRARARPGGEADVTVITRTCPPRRDGRCRAPAIGDLAEPVAEPVDAGQRGEGVVDRGESARIAISTSWSTANERSCVSVRCGPVACAPPSARATPGAAAAGQTSPAARPRRRSARAVQQADHRVAPAGDVDQRAHAHVLQVAAARARARRRCPRPAHQHLRQRRPAFGRPPATARLSARSPARGRGRCSRSPAAAGSTWRCGR
jgi:hypothetical protein